MFDEGGVWQLKTNVIDARRLEDAGCLRGTWASVDSGSKKEPPIGVITKKGSPFFVVHAASLDGSRYKEWAKQRGGSLIHMNPWTWQEIWAG